MEDPVMIKVSVCYSRKERDEFASCSIGEIELDASILDDAIAFRDSVKTAYEKCVDAVDIQLGGPSAVAPAVAASGIAVFGRSRGIATAVNEPERQRERSVQGRPPDVRQGVGRVGQTAWRHQVVLGVRACPEALTTGDADRVVRRLGRLCLPAMAGIPVGRSATERKREALSGERATALAASVDRARAWWIAFK